MTLFPTSDLAKAAAKVLTKDLKVPLTADFAHYVNADFALYTAQYAEEKYLRVVAGRYYQSKSGEFLQQGPETKGCK